MSLRSVVVFIIVYTANPISHRLNVMGKLIQKHKKMKSRNENDLEIACRRDDLKQIKETFPSKQ